MIKIHFWQDSQRGTVHMKVSGHANAAPKGEDVVCSAATMLVYTVAQALTFMNEQGQLAEKPRISIREGKALVVARPREDYLAEALHTFWVAQCGAHVLAKNYPDHVVLNHLKPL